MRALRFMDFIAESEMLAEDRVDFLKDKYEKAGVNTEHEPDGFGQHTEPKDIVQHFATHADPSKNKAYTDWIMDKYGKRQFRQEDHGQVHNSLSNFDKYKPKLEKKDINQYKTLSDLDDAVRPHLGTAVTNKEKAKEVEEAGRKKLIDNGHTQVYRLDTKEASQNIYGGGSEKGGTGTNWCTAAKSDNNLFDRYHARGPLYTFHVKDDAKSPYQLHIPDKDNSGMEFQDRHNHNAQLGDVVKHVPEIKDHPAFAGKHPLFDSEEKQHEKINKYDDPGYVREVIRAGAKLPEHMYNDVAEKAIAHGEHAAEFEKDQADRHRSVISSLLSNHNTSSAALNTLTDHITSRNNKIMPDYQQSNIADHPHITDEIAHKLLSHKSTRGYSVDDNLAANPHSSPELLHHVYKNAKIHTHLGDSVVERVAENHKTATHTLDEIAAGRNHLARDAALTNPNTTPETLMKHVMGPSKFVHAAASTNPNVPEEGLRHIFNQNKNADHIHENLAHNPNTPSDVLQTLASHPDKTINKPALAELKRRVPKRGAK